MGKYTTQPARHSDVLEKGWMIKPIIGSGHLGIRILEIGLGA